MNIGRAIIVEPAKTLILQFLRLTVKAIGVLLILILGWLISNLVKNIVIRILKTLRVDLLTERTGLDNILEKGGIRYSLSEILGEIIYWVGILITFVVASNAIGLTILADLLNKIILYIPNIIAAIFILVLGILVSILLGNIIKTAANNAKIIYSNILANIVKGIIIIFAVVISLNQLNINARILEFVVIILIASIGLAFAIAFGLGCKDIATDLMQTLIKKLKK